jgi:hypothetical protein
MTPHWKQTPLERAAEIARAFQETLQAQWSSMWPHGHCGVSSLLLNPMLTAAVPQLCTRVAIGVCLDARVHAWVESDVGDLIDPTFGQFMDHDFNYEFPLLIAPAHMAHLYGHCADTYLTPSQEDFYRRSIDPFKLNGWSARSKINALFSNYPRAAG